MDFIRKNWSRLSLAFLYLIGGVIAVIAWVINAKSIFSSEDWLVQFNSIALLVSTIAFFFGMVAITIVKSLQSKKAVSVIYMVIGGIATLALLVYIIVASCQNADLVVFAGEEAQIRFYMLWVPFIVFGLHPLIKGVTRFVESTAIPAKAPVAPVVAEQPAVETPAEAPKKAPAKKTTKAAK